MIGFLRGKVHAYSSDYVLLDVNNVGYRISFFHPSYLTLNEEVLIYTFESITEYEQNLYGFISIEEYELFVKLISVKGIGPKVASGILAIASVEEMVNAIENEDIDFIKKMPSIGSKTASQIILDLKGKLVASSNNSIEEEKLKDVSDALKALGYRDKEIKPVIKVIAKEELTEKEYIRKALSLLSK